MKINLVILSFLLAYFTSQGGDTILTGRFNAEKIFKAPVAESMIFSAEKQDTDFTWMTTVAKVTGEELQVAAPVKRVTGEITYLHKGFVNILYLDLPPPGEV